MMVLFVLLVRLSAISVLGVRSETVPDETLQCVCTTSTCREAGEPICLTSGLCYTQFLDRKDGSDPITKGCVNRKTPLLCENRRPKGLPAKAKWPILVCCRTAMCNQVDLPFQVLSKAEEILSGGNETSDSQEGAAAAGTQSEKRPTDGSVAVRSRTNQSKGKSFSNPTVLATFVIGLAALLAIGITGCCVLQRQQIY